MHTRLLRTHKPLHNHLCRVLKNRSSEELLTLIGKFLGYQLWTDLWKAHLIVNFRILGHETGRFLENSSKIILSKNDIRRYPRRDRDRLQIWTSFPEIGPALAPISG